MGACGRVRDFLGGRGARLIAQSTPHGVDELCCVLPFADEAVEIRALDADEFRPETDSRELTGLHPAPDRPVGDPQIVGGLAETEEPRGSGGFVILGSLANPACGTRFPRRLYWVLYRLRRVHEVEDPATHCSGLLVILGLRVGTAPPTSLHMTAGTV